MSGWVAATSLKISFRIIGEVNLHKVGADNKQYTANNAVKKIALGKVFSSILGFFRQ